MTAQRESVVRTIGLSVELFGICLFAMLPLAYCIAEVVLFLTGDEFGLSRLAVGVLAWGVIAAIIARAATLYPAWRAEATDKHKAR